MRVLGIETTCDETAAARRATAPGRRRRHPRQRDHEPDRRARGLWRRRAGNRGARPCRGHRRPDRTRASPGRVCRPAISTRSPPRPGPGLIGGVLVGLTAGKGFALAAGKPFVAVNHLEAHALVGAAVDSALDFPYLLLLASGGHTQLLVGQGRRRLPAARRDARRRDRRSLRQGRQDAGPALPRRSAGRGARRATAIPQRFALPRPMIGRPNAGFLALRPEDRDAADGRARSRR